MRSRPHRRGRFVSTPACLPYHSRVIASNDSSTGRPALAIFLDRARPLDEQEQIQPGAFAEALARIAGPDRLQGDGRADEVRSGLLPSSSAGSTGSSTMPHLGHASGWSCLISGCIGQV